jgi:hypothetical protein
VQVTGTVDDEELFGPQVDCGELRSRNGCVREAEGIENLLDVVVGAPHHHDVALLHGGEGFRIERGVCRHPLPGHSGSRPVRPAPALAQIDRVFVRQGRSPGLSSTCPGRLRNLKPAYHYKAITQRSWSCAFPSGLCPSCRHLERVLRVYIRHYNRQRPNRALHLQAPEQEQFDVTPLPVDATVRRRDRLAGLLHEYYRPAA